MNTIRYIKSFSKGQITIPKEFREFFGIGDEFWLKIHIADGKLIAEPIEQKHKTDYKKTLLGIKEILDLSSELNNNREQIEKQLKKQII